MHDSYSPVAVMIGALAAATPSLAQDPRPAPVSVLETTTVARTADGAFEGRGADYSVRFGARSVRFTPALGRAAPHELPVELELEAVGRRGRPLRPAAEFGVPVPAHAQDVVEYARGEIIERYNLSPRCVEQSFVFGRRPAGHGDLIVRLRVTTELTPARCDSGVAFVREAIGGVEITKVVGIDADGARIDGAIRWRGDGTLELTLPAAFVDAATLPFVLDPLIGTVLDTRGSAPQGEEFAPDVAYSSVRDEFLIVFAKVFSAVRADIIAQRLDGTTGAVVGPQQLIARTSAPNPDPVVAYVRAADDFVVMWRDGWRVVPANWSTTPGSTQLMPQMTGSFDLGGNATTGHAEFVRVYEDSSKVQARRYLVQPNNAIVAGPGFGTDLSLATGWGLFDADGQIAISNSGGAPHRFLVVWQRTSPLPTSPPTIQGTVLSRDLTVLATVAPSGLSGSRGDREPSCDGDGTRWIVAHVRDESVGSTDADIIATSYAYLGSSAVEMGSEVLLPSASDDEREPAVGYLGDSVLAAYSDEFVGSNYAVEVAHVDLVDCRRCEGVEIVSTSTFSDLRRVAIATKRSANGSSTSGDALIVWQSTSFLGRDVYARRYSTANVGEAVDLGGGCGNGGVAFAACARIPNLGFSHRLINATRNAGALLVLSLDTLDAGCGPCRVVPRVFDAFFEFTTTGFDGSATVSMGLPNVTALRGLSFVEQWIVSTGSATPACAPLGFDLSNALRVTIE